MHDQAVLHALRSIERKLDDMNGKLTIEVSLSPATLAFLEKLLVSRMTDAEVQGLVAKLEANDARLKGLASEPVSPVGA